MNSILPGLESDQDLAGVITSNLFLAAPQPADVTRAEPVDRRLELSIRALVAYSETYCLRTHLSLRTGACERSSQRPARER